MIPAGHPSSGRTTPHRPKRQVTTALMSQMALGDSYLPTRPDPPGVICCSRSRSASSRDAYSTAVSSSPPGTSAHHHVGAIYQRVPFTCPRAPGWRSAGP